MSKIASVTNYIKTHPFKVDIPMKEKTYCLSDDVKQFQNKLHTLLPTLDGIVMEALFGLSLVIKTGIQPKIFIKNNDIPSSKVKQAVYDEIRKYYLQTFGEKHTESERLSFDLTQAIIDSLIDYFNEDFIADYKQNEKHNYLYLIILYCLIFYLHQPHNNDFDERYIKYFDILFNEIDNVNTLFEDFLKIDLDIDITNIEFNIDTHPYINDESLYGVTDIILNNSIIIDIKANNTRGTNINIEQHTYIDQLYLYAKGIPDRDIEKLMIINLFDNRILSWDYDKNINIEN
jgi:hypothetical protein